MAAVSGVVEAGAEQLSLPGIDDYFLQERLVESRILVQELAAKTEKPLVIQFSGGRDSMAVLGLVQEVTDNYVCSYMASGLEFKGTIPFVKRTCEQYGAQLLISNPGMHKGNIFKRLERLKCFPGMIASWCCRDLKLRPQRKMLIKMFGKGTFYKLEGVRLFESTRRRRIYADYRSLPWREDSEFRGSYEVFPIINWTNRDVRNYLEMKGLPTMGHYKEFGVSGCSYCPFYGPDIYRRILARLPDHAIYKRIIEWENKLGEPSVSGYYFLRDIKREVLEGIPARPVVPVPVADKLDDEVAYGF